jgi:hypothetical protein
MFLNVRRLRAYHDGYIELHYRQALKVRAQCQPG